MVCIARNVVALCACTRCCHHYHCYQKCLNNIHMQTLYDEIGPTTIYHHVLCTHTKMLLQIKTCALLKRVQGVLYNVAVLCTENSVPWEAHLSQHWTQMPFYQNVLPLVTLWLWRSTLKSFLFKHVSVTLGMSSYFPKHRRHCLWARRRRWWFDDDERAIWKINLHSISIVLCARVYARKKVTRTWKTFSSFYR